MTAKEFMDFLHILERLKCSTRHGWTSTGRRESVSGKHSYRLVRNGLSAAGRVPGAGYGKVLDMCIVHDWGEAVTGDIPSFLKTEADETGKQRRERG